MVWLSQKIFRKDVVSWNYATGNSTFLSRSIRQSTMPLSADSPTSSSNPNLMTCTKSGTNEALRVMSMVIPHSTTVTTSGHLPYSISRVLPPTPAVLMTSLLGLRKTSTTSKSIESIRNSAMKPGSSALPASIRSNHSLSPASSAGIFYVNTLYLCFKCAKIIVMIKGGI